MAVRLHDFPAEGPPLLAQGLQGEDVDGVAVRPHPAAGPLPLAVAGVAAVVGEAIVLDAVVVHNGDEIVQAVVGGAHGRLPGLALVAVAVGQEAVDAVIAAVQARSQGQTHAEGEPHPQGAGRHLHPRRHPHDGVPLQAAPQPTEGEELVHREVAGLGQDGVVGGGGVPLAEDEPVPLRPLGVLRVVAQDVEVEGDEDVGGGEGASGMPGAGRRRHADDVLPHTARYRLERLEPVLGEGRQSGGSAPLRASRKRDYRPYPQLRATEGAGPWPEARFKMQAW
ncbi:hypothetical protein HRbin25_00972 [bacterium HR25]|nr:hypothetical protein HRbin25_00972 [bacterium HR25]